MTSVTSEHEAVLKMLAPGDMWPKYNTSTKVPLEKEYDNLLHLLIIIAFFILFILVF